MLWGVGSMDATIDQMHAEMGETSWKVTSTGTLQTNMKGLVPEMEVDEQGRDYYNSFDFDLRVLAVSVWEWTWVLRTN